MTALLEPYSLTVCMFGVIGALMIVQMLISDVAGIKSGHKAGSQVEVDHRNFHFRSVRALANTNESIAIFILLALFGMFSGANPAWLNGLAATYVAARAGHMLCYYAGQGLARSTLFTVGLLAQIGMLVVALMK